MDTPKDLPPLPTKPIEAAEVRGSELRCGVLFGEFVRAGTMNVSGEETIGCAIAMTEESLRSAPRLPFYRRVAIVVAEDYERLDRYCAALEEQLDSIGLQKAQHIAGLSSPNNELSRRPPGAGVTKEN